MVHMFDQDYKVVIESIEKRNLQVDSLILTGTFPYNGIYLGHVYKCPIILFSNIGFGMHMTNLVGNPENPSYQNEIGLPFIEPYSFKLRLVNTLVYYMTEYDTGENRFMLPLLKERAGMSYQDVQNVYSNVSLVLQASHIVTHNAQPLTPNVINVGGIHCTPAKPLPDDLRQFMDKHTNGVVYVSFGSTVKPNDMSLKRKQAFIEAFKKLKYQVLWKWNEDHIPDLPSNVKLTKWTPQQDLLAHPNLKVFVTHGGLLSLQEAIYHKTPLVGVPLGNDQVANILQHIFCSATHFALHISRLINIPCTFLGNDQVPNILRAEQKGYAVMLDWSNFTADGLYNAIDKAINDPRVTENMKIMNAIFLDQRESPVERAVYWVGYVMRHNGAHFLKPMSMHLTWYEYHHVDFILLILLVLTVLIFVIVKLFFCCCKRLRKIGVKYKAE